MVFDARGMFVEHGFDCFPDVFFLDSDVLIAPNDLLQLLTYPREQFPIVSGLYWAKRGDRCPAAWVLAKKEHDTTSRYMPMHVPDYGKIPNGGLLEVNGVVGAGCLLIRGEVFERVPAPWFVFGTGRTHSLIIEDIGNGKMDVDCSEDYIPPRLQSLVSTPYGYIYSTEHKESEDFYFCSKARDYGFKIYLDPNIRCAHEYNGKMNGDGYPMVGGD
jgi:hypothetical protein